MEGAGLRLITFPDPDMAFGILEGALDPEPLALHLDQPGESWNGPRRCRSRKPWREPPRYFSRRE
jgi:hypothetical protein